MLESFCTDKIWNWNETWNTEVPDFSSCFQDTVLVLVPCIVFTFIGLFNVLCLCRCVPLVSLPWAWRFILKLVFAVLLFIICVSWCSLFVYKKFISIDGSASVPISTVTASFAKTITYVVIIILMLKHKSHGITTSTVLSIFWICFTCCGVIMHRSIILKHSTQHTPPDWNYILSMVYYPILYLELVLSFFSDAKSFTSLERGNPLDEEPFISGVLYLWFTKYVYIGLKRLLTVKDFLPLAVKLKASYLYDVFATHWKFHSTASDVQKISLSRTLFKTVWPWLTAGLYLEIVFIATLLLPPLLLDRIIEFVQDDYYEWRIFFYCGTIFVTSIFTKTVQNNSTMYLLCAAAQVKSVLSSAIFRKNLLIASSARKDFTSGGITNLISVDTQRIANFALYSSVLIVSPLRIVCIVAFMWQYLGPSCLAGVAVVVLLIPLLFYASRKSEKFTEKQMEAKDLRLKVINEVLNGIKILKFYAWEVPFSSKVLKTRKEEIKLIRLSQLCYVVMSFVFSCTPILVSIACFTTFLLVDSKNILDPARAFVSLNLLDQLRFALFEIPDSISELIQTITAIKRIETFLATEETDQHIVGTNPVEGEAVTVKQATFFWSKETDFELQNIDLSVPFGKLIAIIGPVGSGKSSLLSAILGEMKKSSGSIDVKGSLAYVPQEAWILNRTLKNNILLEKPMQELKYNRILDCCCLRPDLEILPGRDETEIGEKGINLSGGQKQRVSLARSLFQNRDIYLLDDPLSAVDAHVRKALFNDVVGNQGLLKNKTRILVSHDISVLPHVDLIIRMEEGKIIESGTYKELMDGNGTFLNFIRTHAGLEDKESGDKPSSELAMIVEKVESAAYRRTISEDWAKPSEIKLPEATLIEDEKMEEGGVKRGIYLNYAKHVGWFLFSLSLIGYVTFSVFEIGSTIWLSQWSADPVHNGTQDFSQTVYRLSGYAGFGAVQAFTIVFGTACLVYGSTKASELYHNQMLDSVLKSPMSFFDVTPMGRIVNRFSTDMDTLDIHLIYEIDGWINCLLFNLATFIVIGIYTPLFLACLLPLGIVYYIFLRLHLNTSRQIQRLESTTRSPIYSHLLESIYGVVSIKAFQVQNKFIEKSEENVDNHIACYFNTISCNRWLHFWLDVISSLVILIATWLAIDNRHELGTSVVGLVVTYALGVTDAMMWFVRTNNELENKSVAIERVDEYCHLQPEAPWNRPEKDPDATWPEQGEIVFDSYSTRYREGLDLVLKELNLSVNAHEKVGIVGRTGAGKSSITLALFRIIEPAHGAILIDNVDLSQIGLHALRSKLTIIPQDPILFTGSLRFNLDPNDEYDDDEIWASLANSHLKEFVTGLAEGLQYSVEEGGNNLSAGQKQLICLSRALLKKSKILILDEATAAVDMDTDKLVQDTIKTAFADHTVITIAHRLNTVMDYDKIVVMDAGEVVEIGSPTSLLQNQDSQFYKLSCEAGLV